MAMRGKIGAFCQVLLLAASVSALSAGIAHAQQASDLDALNEQILNNPTDVDLNMRYAAAAEAAGKPRLALETYERILINDPTNEPARRGYERLRRQIEPGYNVTRVELGARFDSDAINLNEDFFFNGIEDSTTYYGKLMIANESELGGRRWRSSINATLEDNDEFDVLDYGFLGAQTGPIFYVGPHLAAIPAIGVGAAWLGGDHYFNEINLGLTVEGRAQGASYWARARVGYREYDEVDTGFFIGTVADNGPYAELQAGLTKPGLVFERGTLLLQPFVRWSDVSGEIFDYAPGQYVEYGIDANYNYQLTDHLQASVGALWRKRDIDTYGGETTYLSPQVSLTAQRLLPCDCDVRLQYRTRDNDTEDNFSDYDAEQWSLALMTRF